MSIHKGHVYKAGRNKAGARTYKVRWYPHRGSREKMKNFSTRHAADAYLKQLIRDELTGSDTSFKVLVAAWLAEREDCCKAGTLAGYKRHLRLYINRAFGDRRDAASITPMDIQQFNQGLIHEGKSSTVRNQVLTILRSIFRFGIRNHLLVKDPTTAIKKPRPTMRDVYVLTLEQRQAIINAPEDEKFKTLFAIAMFTGLRQGELLGLRWSAIDFERGVIVVREQFTSGRWDTPKNGKTRDAPFDNQTSDWLKNWRANGPHCELVFPADNGNPMNAKNMCTREWRPALLHSGVAGEVAASGHPPFRFHDLRHVYASLLINNKASLWEVKNALGHASITTTERTYGHLVPGIFDRLRKDMGEITDGIRLDSKQPLRAVN